jgi:solute carrier family 25, member 33/36
MLPVSSLGGMCGAIVTSPFDVVKTRLQSSLFREKHTASVNVVTNGIGSTVLTVPSRRVGLLWHFVETGHIIRFVFSGVIVRCIFR